MYSLMTDIHQFNPDSFGTLEELTWSVRDCDQRLLVVACSEQGSAPDNISIADSNQLLIIQNLAASISPPGTDGEPMGSIEFAIGMHGAQHAIVCGHSRCGVLKNWLRNRDQRMTHCATDEFERKTLATLEECYPGLSNSEFFDLLIREHILFQIENLLSHDWIRERVEEGQLRVYGWLVDDDSAQVHPYNPRTGQFAPVSRSSN